MINDMVGGNFNFQFEQFYSGIFYKFPIFMVIINITRYTCVCMSCKTKSLIHVLIKPKALGDGLRLSK